MNERFVDTGFWIGVTFPRDQRHTEAKRIFYELPPSDVFVTSEFVLIEYLNHFSERGPEMRRFAANFIRSLEDNKRTRVIPVSRELYLRGLSRFERYHDKGWSLTDCTSFLIMEDFGIHHALAFDNHFEQAGFQVM